MTPGKRYKPKLAEEEKERRRRLFIAYTYATVSLSVLSYYLLQDELSAIHVAKYTFSFLTTADNMTLNFLQLLLEKFSPAN